MKLLSPFIAFAPLASAHYNFPSMIYNGAITPAWQYVRQWTNYYAYTPVQDVTSLDIRCNVNGTKAFAPSTLSVAAGSSLGFTVDPDIYHAGPALAYMAKVPTGQTAANWDGSGSVWFKVWQVGPVFGGQALTWPTDGTILCVQNGNLACESNSNVWIGATSVTFTIPKNTPSGEYLVRIEHIALHVAQSSGAAQFYLSCGQVSVTSGGSGTPGPLVAFPGAYQASDPGILINIYYPVVSHRLYVLRMGIYADIFM
jgi:hypothetical protein